MRHACKIQAVEVARMPPLRGTVTVYTFNKLPRRLQRHMCFAYILYSRKEFEWVCTQFFTAKVLMSISDNPQGTCNEGCGDAN